MDSGAASEDEIYRSLIDRMVRRCSGQGQIVPKRVLAGIWDGRPATDVSPDSAVMNEVLALLSADKRAVLAQEFARQYEAGIHDALVVLCEEGIRPFDRAYEGDAFHDFVGRNSGWDWPLDEQRM